MEIQFGENKIKVNVSGKIKEEVKDGQEVYAVLAIRRRDSKWEGAGYKMNLSLHSYEHLKDERTGREYTLVRTCSDWMFHGLKAKFMEDVARRTKKTDDAAVAWVRERLSSIFHQFLNMNLDVELAEEVK